MEINRMVLKKTALVMGTFMLCMLMAVPVRVYASKKNKGWYQDDNFWYYADSKGRDVTGWKQIDGKWYYFYFSGAMATGVEDIDGSYYRFRNNGAMVTGWYRDAGGSWYYYLPNGKAAVGWKQIGGKWYYFYDGYMATGEEYINGSYFRFDDNGAMITGWYKDIWGNGEYDWNYYLPSGKKTIGWQKINETWYCFDKWGDMENNRSAVIGGRGYYFSDDGALQGENGGWIQGSGGWYYADKGGSLTAGWKKISEKWYYFDAEDGYKMLAGGTFTIDQKPYTFDANGVWTGQ